MKLIFLLVVNLIVQMSFSQTLNGTILNIEKKPIENANVSIWNSVTKENLLGYVYTDQKGFFSVKIKAEVTTVFIAVSCLDFALNFRQVSINQINQIEDFILERKEIQLDEIVIKDEKAVRVKNDTTFYDPKKFLSGDERKIEDLIRKLPGITVNEKTGEIKFKGKSIETVKLEGDDLFGGNYALGTKNISVDMVEQLQAIENYSDNPLLNGIESSNKVAINLKLKKHKTDYSGTITANNGFSNKLLLYDEITLLGISKKIKSFGISFFNNFGGGTIDVNSFSQGFNSYEIPEKEFYAKKLLSEPVVNSSLPNNRTKFNNTSLLNYNIVYKLSNKISVKNNLILLHDEANASEKLNNIFFINNGLVATTQENIFNKKAQCFKADFKFTFNLNKRSLLVTSLGFFSQNSKSRLNILQNNFGLFQNNLNSNDLFFKTKTNYTWRINEKKAFQFYSEFSKSDVPQELIISPSTSFLLGTIGQNSIQKSNFEKQFFINKATFLVNKNEYKQTFSFGFYSESNPLNSDFIEGKICSNGFVNKNNYKKTNLFWEYFSNFVIKKITFQPYLSSNFYHQNLTIQTIATETEKSNLVFKGNLLLEYKFKKFGNFFTSASFDNHVSNEEYLFANKIVINNNFIKNNIPSLEIVKSQNLSCGYKYYNLMKQFGFDFSLQLENKMNTILSNITINPNFTAITYFQDPTNIKTTNVNLNLEKRIQSLNLYVKQTSSYSVNNYLNAVNNSALRTNISKNFNASILTFSSFNCMLNFDNKFNFNLMNFNSDNNINNQRIALNNTFKISLRPNEKWIYSVTYDYFVTDTKLNNNFTFIDFDIKYKSLKSKWLSFNLTGRNLMNLRIFSEINKSDFSSTYYSANILPRYFLLSSNFSF